MRPPRADIQRNPAFEGTSGFWRAHQVELVEDGESHLVPQVGRGEHDKRDDEDAVAGAHDLIRELQAEVRGVAPLEVLGTDLAKEGDEEEDRDDHDRAEEVAHEDVEAHDVLKGEEAQR